MCSIGHSWQILLCADQQSDRHDPVKPHLKEHSAYRLIETLPMLDLLNPPSFDHADKPFMNCPKQKCQNSRSVLFRGEAKRDLRLHGREQKTPIAKSHDI